MFHQKLLSLQRQCKQKNVFLQSGQQFNSINKLPFYLKGFHPYFIDLFENCLEIFPSRRIVNDLTFVHNTNKFFQVKESKSSSSQSGLLSLPSNIFQSLIEIHPDFYDPIGSQLEMKFQEREILIKFLTITVHSDFIFNFLSSIRFVFLLLTFQLHIYAGIKKREWLHWKYDYT